METNQTKESIAKEKRRETNKKYYQKTRELLKTTGVELKPGRPRTKPEKNDLDDTVIWKDIVGFENYQVSDHGHVRNKKTKNLLKPQLVKFKTMYYYDIQLYLDKKPYHKLIHRLMAISFNLPKRDDQIQVDHINRISTDNRICNLRWVTPLENMQNRNTKMDVADLDDNEIFISEGAYLMHLKNTIGYKNLTSLQQLDYLLYFGTPGEEEIVIDEE